MKKFNLFVSVMILITSSANARCLYTGDEGIVQQVKQAYGRPAEERKRKNGESPDADFRIAQDPVSEELIATPLGGLRDGEKACAVTPAETKDSDNVRSCKKVSKCIRKIVRDRRGVQVSATY